MYVRLIVNICVCVSVYECVCTIMLVDQAFTYSLNTYQFIPRLRFLLLINPYKIEHFNYLIIQLGLNNHVFFFLFFLRDSRCLASGPAAEMPSFCHAVAGP